MGMNLMKNNARFFDGGKEIDLTTKEFDLLMMFIKIKVWHLTVKPS